MGSVGVRELKQRTSQVLRRLRETGQQVEVTCRGQVVAVLVPVSSPRPGRTSGRAVWTDLDRLAAEIGARWPAGLTAEEAVSEERR